MKRVASMAERDMVLEGGVEWALSAVVRRGRSGKKMEKKFGAARSAAGWRT